MDMKKVVDKINNAVLEMPDGSRFRCDDCGSELFMKTTQAGIYSCANCGTMYQVTTAPEITNA